MKLPRSWSSWKPTHLFGKPVYKKNHTFIKTTSLTYIVVANFIGFKIRYEVSKYIEFPVPKLRKGLGPSVNINPIKK